ncbi:MAG: response regulator [Sterolibacterium sp.]|nr:response regulator [Sterolibacterium sp.]
MQKLPVHFLQRLRALVLLLPGSRAFHAAGIRTKISVLFYLTAFSAIAAIGLYGYLNAGTAYRERAIQLLESSRDGVAANIDEFIALQRDNLTFLNNFYAIQRYAYWKEMNDKAKMEEWRNVAGDTLRDFTENNRYYYKIRFLGRDGQEAIVVQDDLASDKSRLLPDSELENQASQDYVVEGLKLKRGEIHVGKLDLKTNHGQIEKPLLPELRFAQPLVGDNNVIYGVTVSSIRAEAIYDFIRAANKNEQGRRFTLIDGDGNYLFHPDAEKQFGHLLGHGANFNKEHPELLAEMRGKTQGMITADGQIHVFRTLYPNPRQRDHYWILVGVVDESVALAELNNFIAVFIALLALLIAMVLWSTRYMLGQLMTPLQFVTRQLERLSRGETQPESLDYPAKDEIRLMLDSTERVVSNLDALARQADAIAGGDLSGQVVALSENDRLGNALNNMTRQLAENHRADTQRNWLKDGLAELAKALTGDLDPQRLAELAIGQVGRYLGAGRGVLYVWNDPEQALDLLGSYMYTERNALGARVKPGEGAVGQVARELKPIILHAFDAGAHAELPPISTGTLSVAPQYTYTWPLQRESNLQGVMEIAASEPLDETQVAYLNAAAETIASFLYAVLQRQRIKELLVIAEEAARQAEEKSRQLQIANTQMEEQQQQLQQQTEELQQTNAQMEEQQQQLQQQTEELQAANAQMEEQQQQLQQQTEELQATNAQMEEQQQLLEQRNRDLLHSQEELDTRAKQLELSSKYKSEFLANMSHELRTPLNSIILLAKMMASNEDKHLGEEEVKRAEVIHRAGQDLLRLINDVLDLSKVEAGRMELNPAPVASSALAEEFRDLFTEPARDKGLTFGVEDAINDSIVVDRDKLSQVVRNLLSNSLKFTRQGGITLRFERRAGDTLPLRISVHDTGIGVAEDKRALIFEAFQQADGSTSREYGGTGLGLSISLSFARLMGGTIELESAPGEGSTFTLVLPETPPAHSAEAPAPLPQQPTLPQAGLRLPVPPAAPPAPDDVLAAPQWPHDDREHIGDDDQVMLLIDDDPVFAQAILGINRRLGYRTLLAGKGSEGLELARSFNPNGILLDLGLPDMDGSAVLHQLKSTPELAAIPVYIISARDRDNTLIDQGAMGYLSKPVDNQQIAAAEAEVLLKYQESAAHGILLLENGTLNEAEIASLVAGEHSQIVTLSAAAAGSEKLAEALAANRFRLAIIDLGDGATATAREVAARLRQIAPGLALIFYGKQPLSEEDDASLRQYSDSIIIRTPQAERRLQENIERFLMEAPRRSRGRTAAPIPEGSGSKRLAGRHILVVDDDPRNLFVITAALEQNGATVDNALNGRRAIELLADTQPNLVVMDIMMPEMDGYKTIQAMRADPRLASIPVLALTAKALPSDREKALAAGADDYLVKPADYAVLINMAAAWCEGRR